MPAKGQRGDRLVSLLSLNVLVAVLHFTLRADLPKLQALYDVRHLMLLTHNQLSVLSDVQLSLWSTLVLA